MRGKAVFYPIGWDDNGLPTERRVQNYFPMCAVTRRFPTTRRSCRRTSRRVSRCVSSGPTSWPSASGSPAWTSRRSSRSGGGWDCRWTGPPSTRPSTRTLATSQRAFLRNLARGEAYLADGPTLWDVTFQTAVAQAELEDREVAGSYVRLGFRRPGRPGGDRGHHPPGAAARLRGPGRAPRRRALRGAGRHDRDHPRCSG